MAVINASDQQVPLDFALADKPRNLWGDAWKRLRRNKLALTGAIILAFLCVVAIGADVIAPAAYDQTQYAPGSTSEYLQNEPPSLAHPFGTDHQARDEFSRVVYGARVSLSVGLPIGLLAGYYGGWVDSVLMRLTDIMYAFPTVLFAIVILAAIGQNLINIYLAIGLTFWPSMARLVRSQVLSLREKEYVEAARAIGVPAWRIMFLQILPNALGPIIVAVTFGIPFAILIEAFLSFIGIGIPVPIPSWGGMIADAKPQLRSEYWLVLFPAAALAITLFSFNFFGDGLRDALDPRSRR